MAATASAAAPEQDPSAVGRWLIESGKAAVDIYRCGSDRLCGKVAWLRRPVGQDGKPLTDRNNPSPALQRRPICGMVTMGGFTRTGRNSWGGGWAYDPENGSTYKAEMTLENPGVLKLRGYIGMPFFGVTQTWTRVASTLAPCRATAS
jgi:uncharacterized protein (DUF2147 family)